MHVDGRRAKNEFKLAAISPLCYVFCNLLRTEARVSGDHGRVGLTALMLVHGRMAATENASTCWVLAVPVNCALEAPGERVLNGEVLSKNVFETVRDAGDGEWNYV